MEEVAAILSASTSAMKVRVHDARRHIEKRLRQNPGMADDADRGGGRLVTELRCADVEARCVDAIDGRLDPADSVRFHAHIEGCASCRERAALWRGLVPEMRGAVPPAPGAMATRRMQIEIERRLAAGDRAARRRGAGGGRGRRRSGWSRPRRRSCCGCAPATRRLPPVGYAALGSVRGGVRVGDRPIATARARAGGRADRAGGGRRPSSSRSTAARRWRSTGPARLTLEGSARDVAVRLRGRARCTRRWRTACPTRRSRCSPRTCGSRCAARSSPSTAAPAGSRVEVTEGQRGGSVRRRAQHAGVGGRQRRTPSRPSRRRTRRRRPRTRS